MCKEYEERLLKTVAKILVVIMSYRKFWVGSCAIICYCESFSPLTCLAGKWRTEHSKTFCEAMSFAKFSLKMFKNNDIFHETFQSSVWNGFQLWSEISLLKMEKKSTLKRNLLLFFTVQCDKWAIFHIANLLKYIFNKSFQTDFFQNIDTLNNFHRVGFFFT